jgi:pSer/pThr/pTyr-binding forkhead associated (FHA) protein
MAGTVVLKVIEGGPFDGSFTFSQPVCCTIGRSEDCDLRIPGTVWFQDISRRHCTLRIAPPEVHIRDLDSRNGTFVNGAKIGQRKSAPAPAGAGSVPFPEWIVQDGDEIRIGHVIFRIQVCPDTAAAESGNGAFI